MGQSVTVKIVYGWKLVFDADCEDEKAVEKEIVVQEMLENDEIDALDDFEPHLGVRDYLSGYTESSEESVHIIGIEVADSCPTRPAKLTNFFTQRRKLIKKLDQWIEECPSELQKYLLSENLGFWVVSTYG